MGNLCSSESAAEVQQHSPRHAAAASGSWVEVGSAEQGSFARSSKKTPSDAWLKELGLTQYAAAFNTAGYGDWQLIALLDEGDLKAIEKHGHVVILPGHRKKLLLASRQMAQPQEQQLSRTSRRSRVQQLRRASRMAECATSQRVHRTVSQPILPSPSVTRVTPLHSLVMDHISSLNGSIRASPPGLPNELLASQDCIEQAPSRCQSLQSSTGAPVAAIAAVAPQQPHSIHAQQGTLHSGENATELMPMPCSPLVPAAGVAAATAGTAVVAATHVLHMAPALRTASAPHLLGSAPLFMVNNHEGSRSVQCSLQDGTGSFPIGLRTSTCGRSASACALTLQRVPMLSPTSSHHFPIPDFAATDLAQEQGEAADTPVSLAAGQPHSCTAVAQQTSSGRHSPGLAPDLSIAVAAGNNSNSGQFSAARRSSSRQGNTSNIDVRQARHSGSEASPRIAWLQGQGAGDSTEQPAASETAEMLVVRELKLHSRSSPDLSQQQLASLPQLPGELQAQEPAPQDALGNSQQRPASAGHLPPIDLRARPQQLNATPSRLARAGSAHKASLAQRHSNNESVPLLANSIAATMVPDVTVDLSAAAAGASGSCRSAFVAGTGTDDSALNVSGDIMGKADLPGRVAAPGQQDCGSPWASRVPAAAASAKARAGSQLTEQPASAQQQAVPAVRADSEFGLATTSGVLLSASGQLRPYSAPMKAPATEIVHGASSNLAAAVSSGQVGSAVVDTTVLPSSIQPSPAGASQTQVHDIVTKQQSPRTHAAAAGAATAAGLPVVQQGQQVLAEKPLNAKPPAHAKPSPSNRLKQRPQVTEAGVAAGKPPPIRLPRSCKMELQALLQDTASWVVRTSSARARHNGSSSEGGCFDAAVAGATQQQEAAKGEQLLEKLQAVLLQLAQVTGAHTPTKAGATTATAAATPQPSAEMVAYATASQTVDVAQPDSISNRHQHGKDLQPEVQALDSVHLQWQQLQQLHGELRSRLQQLGCTEAAQTSPPRPASRQAVSRHNSHASCGQQDGAASADMTKTAGAHGSSSDAVVATPVAADARQALHDIEARVRAQLVQLAALVKDAQSRTPSGRGAVEEGDPACPAEQATLLSAAGLPGHSDAVGSTMTAAGSDSTQQPPVAEVLSVLAVRKQSMQHRKSSMGKGQQQTEAEQRSDLKAQPKKQHISHRDASQQHVSHRDANQQHESHRGANQQHESHRGANQQHESHRGASQGGQSSMHNGQQRAGHGTSHRAGQVQVAQSVESPEANAKASQYHKLPGSCEKLAGQLAGQLRHQDGAGKLGVPGVTANADDAISALRGQ